MANYTLSPSPWLTFEYTDGRPVAGGQLFTYQSGQGPAATTYSTSGGTPNTNPIILDAAGRATIFLVPGNSYYYALYDSVANGGAFIKDQDNVSAVPSASEQVVATGIAGQTLTAGQVAYLSDGSGALTAGRWYLAQANNAYSSTTPEVGFVAASVASGLPCSIIEIGNVTGLVVTVGLRYYIDGTTPGAITSTAPTLARYMGQADSGTSLVTGRPPVPVMPVTNGTIPIGNGTASPTNAAITVSQGLTITNGAGSIAIAGTVLSKSTTEQTVSNSATITSVFSFSVPGGTLGTTGILRFTMTGEYVNTSGGNSNFTPTCVYGATTVMAGSVTNFATATTGAFRMVIELNANGATGSQRAAGAINMITSGGSVASATWAQSGLVNTAFNTGIAEDSTAAKTFAVSVTHSTADPAIIFRAWSRVLEIL